ncbi:hypothetical protein MSG28_016062 [Choristoneura fumiferana]|uniref:Uncharacterized protein n=1 Tax=Choristoneura fumiferana TaxID=7141 RepID=A0ACC0K534_CHOFU|nr:hypothetical protein MSG28_016062 [Choristoneura fumiferana]
MDQFQYKNILEETMLPYAEGVLPVIWTFQHDNDPKHTLTSQSVSVLDWPANSPDLNPIEHLWCEVKKKFQIDKKHVPSFGANTGEDDKDVKKEPNLEYLKIIKEDKNNKYSKLTSALVNTGTTKMSSSSQEVGKKFKGKNALRTTKYESHERNYIKSNAKKVSWENTSEDDDTRYAITKIDFKAKDGSKEEEFEDKSLESYKPRKKGKKQKKESKFDDNNDDFTTTKKETSRTTPKRKETTSAIDDNYSGYSNKKKRNRWEKEERSEERIKFKPPRREPRKEERIYEMNKPRIKTQLNRPLRNQVSKIRNNNMGNNNYKAYGRTPIPIVGKKVVYEDD